MLATLSVSFSSLINLEEFTRHPRFYFFLSLSAFITYRQGAGISKTKRNLCFPLCLGFNGVAKPVVLSGVEGQETQSLLLGHQRHPLFNFLHRRNLAAHQRRRREFGRKRMHPTPEHQRRRPKIPHSRLRHPPLRHRPPHRAYLTGACQSLPRLSYVPQRVHPLRGRPAVAQVR